MIATPSQAVVYATAADYSPDAMFGREHIVSPAYFRDGYAGRFLSTFVDTDLGKTFDIYSFCADIKVDYGTYFEYNYGPLSLITPDAVKQQQLAALLANANAEIDGSATTSAKELAAAGIALAIFEVIYETGNSGYSLNGGNFFTDMDFASLGVNTAANGYLSKVGLGQWPGSIANVRALISVDGHSQNQIYYLPGVPEPTTWMLMILGIGFVGVALRKQRVPATA